MIPKTIHYCWFGKGPKSDLNKRCLDSWQSLMPDYQIKEWNETTTPLDNEYSHRAYSKGLWAKLSNLVRFQALYTEGGIYLDTDVEAVKSLTPLLRQKCFVGFQVEAEQTDWVNTAVLGAERGHQFLKRSLDLTQELFAATGKFYRSPMMTTRILKEMGLQQYGFQEIEDVTIYPLEYFYPFPWTGKLSPDCVKKNTYCIHHWEGTWLKKEHSKVLRPLRAIQRIVRAHTSKGK
jgi:mannosyltransferase OCH1-like enzyme